MDITVDILGERQLNRRLGVIIERSANIFGGAKGVGVKVQKDWIKNNRAQFRTKGVHGSGERWARLSTSYRKWKARHYPGKPIMRRTDRLWHSLTQPGHPDFVYRTSLQQMVIGTNVPYAIYHQSQEPRTSELPRRPVVELREDQKLLWSEFIRKHIFSSGIDFERITL